MRDIVTCVSNPGIADRLEEDVSCFESYGFTFQRIDPNSGTLIYHQHKPFVNPISIILIKVGNPSLLYSVGPFLRTLVRLCIDPIDPRSLRAVLICNHRIKDARTMAHAIHMIIRNSMGAALFLDFNICLPMGMTKESIVQEMQRNDDGCYEYPSVALHTFNSIDDILLGGSQPFEIEIQLSKDDSVAPMARPLARETLKGFDPTKHHLSLQVQTRMCTLRLTPILWSLANKLLGNSINDNVANQNQHLFICLEKLSNLYRIIMLLRDRAGLDAIESQLVIIVKSETDAILFRDSAKDFILKNFCSTIIPKVTTVEKAVTLLESICPPVVAVDLHPRARNLENHPTVLDDAGAIIWGFESDGIPIEISKLANEYVQMQSRTSVNVIAAVSIILHVAWTK